VRRASGTAPPFFRKNAEPHRNLLKVFLRTLPGKVLEKFQIFSDPPAGFMRVFDSGERRLPACSRNERRDQYPRARKRVKELGILRAMNENKFQVLSRSSAKLLSLEQVIDLIDKAREGWKPSKWPQELE
jgi:hypothetical protein